MKAKNKKKYINMFHHHETITGKPCWETKQMSANRTKHVYEQLRKMGAIAMSHPPEKDDRKYKIRAFHTPMGWILFLTQTNKAKCTCSASEKVLSDAGARRFLSSI